MKPNIVFVLCDQMRAQAAGYAGDPNVQTPNLDTLAFESTEFATAVSNCPVCCPYRASLLTGRYPLEHGIFVNGIRLNNGAVSMAEAFGGCGYDTAYIGKWHVDGLEARDGFVPPERRQGFGFWRAFECTHNYWESFYYADEPVKLKWEGYDAFAQTRCAVEYLESRKSNKTPFFLLISFGPPHTPFETAPDEYKEMYDAEDLVLRPNVPEANQALARNELVGYYAHITAIDKCVGMIRDCLKSTSMDQNTIFVFASDHGELAQSQGEARKMRPWDESILVPFLLYDPVHAGKRRRRISTPLSAPDIMPTLLGLAGVPVPGTVTGVSFAPHLMGQGDVNVKGALVACYYPFANYSYDLGGREYRGVRTERHTYVRDLRGPWLLYDNENDPYQRENLCNRSDASDIQQNLDNLLSEVLQEQGDEFLRGGEYLSKYGYTAVNRHEFRQPQASPSDNL